MPTRPTPAEVFPPGEYLADELAARGWLIDDLAARTGISPEDIRSLLANSRRLLAHEAEALGRALGTSAELWLRLQRTYTRFANAKLR